jgi:hypothetical protein
MRRSHAFFTSQIAIIVIVIVISVTAGSPILAGTAWTTSISISPRVTKRPARLTALTMDCHAWLDCCRPSVLSCSRLIGVAMFLPMPTS